MNDDTFSVIKKLNICGHLDLGMRIKVTMEQRQNANVFLYMMTIIVLKSKTLSSFLKLIFMDV